VVNYAETENSFELISTSDDAKVVIVIFSVILNFKFGENLTFGRGLFYNLQTNYKRINFVVLRRLWKPQVC